MKIGIYTAYGPQVVLGKEGLGRYIGNLISGFVAAGHQVTIACPKWSLDTIDDLLQDFQVDAESVEFIVSSKTPALWLLYEKKYRKRYPKRSLRYRLMNSFADCIEWVVTKAISITSLICLALLALLAVVAGIMLLPVVLVFTVLYLLVKLVLTIVRKGKFSVQKLFDKIMEIMQIFSTKKTNLHAILSEQLGIVVSQSLAQKINRSAQRDVWFVPTVFWPEVKLVDGLKVICAPDLVTVEFPALFADLPGMVYALQKCQDVLEDGQYFITYSEYLRKSLVMERFGKDASQVIAIPHINNDMLDYIQIASEVNNKLHSDKDFSLDFARRIIQNAKMHCLSVDQRYIANLQMQDIHYIFYASQIRPYKNILTLVKAYEQLLRKKYWNIKLIITGNLGDSSGIYSYIKEHRLEYDVLSMPGVSAQELAALYRCADLVVNPTLYEGGFPFTFGEGMSVGTPSLMSDIPQVRDVVENYGLEDAMLFDPYDWHALADKIECALQNREELYQKELPMYQDMAKRTGDVVAQAYIEAFEYFIEKDQKDQRKEERPT